MQKNQFVSQNFEILTIFEKSYSAIWPLWPYIQGCVGSHVETTLAITSIFTWLQFETLMGFVFQREVYENSFLSYAIHVLLLYKG